MQLPTSKLESEVPNEYPMATESRPQSQNGSLTDISQKIALDGLYDDDTDESLDPVYHAKARILNNATQEIGMGRYQWYLFCCAGFGWFA